MSKNLNMAIAPKDSTFQVKINSEIKKAVEKIYAKNEKNGRKHRSIKR